MTDWVIHFTRNTEWGDAKSNLISIINTGVIVPNWAFGKGTPTIYGCYPAVCFTEQPLWAFNHYVTTRNDPTNVTGYGLLLHKNDLFASGGLPVIYGVEKILCFNKGEIGYQEGKRIIKPEYFPYDEQYRFVNYNPNRDSYPIDWTFEREWRWSDKNDTANIGGYPLSGRTTFSSDKKYSQGRTHILVEKNSDVQWIQSSVTNVPLQDQSNMYRNIWLQDLRTKVRIISMENVIANLNLGDSIFGKAETILPAI